MKLKHLIGDDSRIYLRNPEVDYKVNEGQRTHGEPI